MRYLIATEPTDSHAILVKLALESLGHQVTNVFFADQPTRQRSAVFVDMTHYLWKSSDRYQVILENEYDVVWWRRPRKPYLPKNLVHMDDYKFVARENYLFYESFTHNLAPTAFWINSKEAANRANFKLLQLKIASECGLMIPTTLCSNDPAEIRKFLGNYSSVIYKPMCTHFWFEDEEVKITYTNRVSLAQLPEHQVLQSTPGLYQAEIQKQYELRIMCFGNYFVAAKLNSQAHPKGEIDWRVIHDRTLEVETYILPEDLQEKIRMFMYALGLVFGVFDFIVTNKGDYVFLEVNEQGQFLWLEDLNPSFALLDIFIQFLLKGSSDFTWDPQQKRHAMHNYEHRLDEIIQDYKYKHIDLTSATMYREQNQC